MAAIDRANPSNNITAPAEFYETATPSDTDGSGDLTYVCRALYVGTGGTVIAIRKDGVEVPFVNVPDGETLPIRAKRVKSTGTTASNIVALGG